MGMHRIWCTAVERVCRVRVTRQQVTGPVAEERWHCTSSHGPVKLSLAADMVQVYVVYYESKSRITFPQSRSYTDRALCSQAPSSPSMSMLLLEVWLLIIPLLAFANISPCTPGLLLCFMGNQAKLLGQMMVEDGLTKLEVVRRSTTYWCYVKMNLTWMGQASVQKFPEAVEICIWFWEDQAIEIQLILARILLLSQPLESRWSWVMWYSQCLLSYNL